jgi:hypothetical protein
MRVIQHALIASTKAGAARPSQDAPNDNNQSFSAHRSHVIISFNIKSFSVRFNHHHHHIDAT